MAGEHRPAARTVLASLVRERKWSHQDFCAAFAATAAEMGLDASVSTQHVGRWLAGKLKGLPYPAQVRVLERMFGVDAEQLFASVPRESERSRTSAGQAWPADPAREISMAAEESARFAEFAEQTNIGPHTLDQFVADIRQIVTVYPNRPVYPLFVELRSLRDRAFQKLEGRQFPNQSRDLYLIAGTLNGVLANASFDLGRLDAAETQARTAFLCAELAGSNWLRAWIRGTQAMLAYWDDRPLDAVHLSEDGMGYEPESGTARVRLASIQARALGMLRDPAGVHNSLQAAEEARESVVADDDPGGMMSFPEGKQAYCASTALLWLGEGVAVDAEAAAQDALNLYEADPVENRRLGELTLARVDLLSARMARGDVDGMLPEVREAVRVVQQRPIESVTRRLRQLDAALKQPRYAGSPVVQSVRDEMRPVISASPRPAVGQ